MTPEGRVKNMVKKGLDALGVHWRFMPVQTGFGGVALDFIICVNGWFISIETKKDAKSKLTPLQQSTAGDIRAAGGLVFTVYDQETCDRAMRIIKGICYGRDSAAYVREEVARQDQQHLRPEQQGETVAASTGGDHGAPRKKSRRRTVPPAGSDNQRVTAAVKPAAEWSADTPRIGLVTPRICPRCHGDLAVYENDPELKMQHEMLCQ
jgi:hypothetical protein